MTMVIVVVMLIIIAGHANLHEDMLLIGIIPSEVDTTRFRKKITLKNKWSINSREPFFEEGQGFICHACGDNWRTICEAENQQPVRASAWTGCCKG